MKKHFLQNLTEKHTFLTKEKFKFLDVVIYLAAGLTCDGWYRSNDC